MKRSRDDKRRMVAAFKRFVANNPPTMPAEFTHKQWRHITGYAYIAFLTGYCTAENDARRSWQEPL